MCAAELLCSCRYYSFELVLILSIRGHTGGTPLCSRGGFRWEPSVPLRVGQAMLLALGATDWGAVLKRGSPTPYGPSHSGAEWPRVSATEGFIQGSGSSALHALLGGWSGEYISTSPSQPAAAAPGGMAKPDSWAGHRASV